MKKIVMLIIMIGLLAVVLLACSDESAIKEQNAEETMTKDEKTEDSLVESESDGKVIFTIEAVEGQWQYSSDQVATAWMYNGKLPGEEIRVNEGDEVELHFLNSLPVTTALHLHGLPITNEMDGVPGVTQNVIQPGEEFVYSFKATLPGTYWYHSHDNSAEQLFRGMYGAIIVEETNKKDYAIDQTVFISEWSAMMEDMYQNADPDENAHGGHGAHGESTTEDSDETNNSTEMNSTEMPHNEMMDEMFDTVVINGKAGAEINDIVVAEGDSIRLRFINSGLYTQTIVIPNHEFKVTHYDGQPVNEPTLISSHSVLIAPGERYDVEIDLNNPGAWGIEIFAEKNKEKLATVLPIVYQGHEDDRLEVNGGPLTTFAMTNYGQSKQIELINQVTKDYQMVLDSNDGDETFTINDKKAPDLEVYEFEAGDVVKMTVTNESGVDHPMHSHGHLFYVISKNGVAVTGSPILKDTLNVKPDETYEIVFIADNPGKWVFHCHELHHADGGMIALIDYPEYEADFQN
ncbi:multicopper oxidase family protein [Bacillaceae bacterium IKA-2]|nr:multicopper oxidase family protein [Bacillaceae bacterium IKA-2]